MQFVLESITGKLPWRDCKESCGFSGSRKGHRLWDRYADDVFSVVKKTDVESFLKHLNEQDPNIRFTTEEEQNNELPLLDVRVTRQDGRLRTGVHRKKTHTDRVLSFRSHHPVSVKRSIIGSLFSRIDPHFGANDIEGREKERQHTQRRLARVH